nr:unnamed protein product [Callosobruchus analis]
MGQLPKSRFACEFRFNVTGTDYAGPFLIKDERGRGAKLSKAYLCIFICFSVRAVHVELVTSLSTETFIMALRRFVSRREDHVPPSLWRLGRVIATHSGVDGQARVATLKTSHGEVRRAFSKICPLPLDN